MAVGSQERYEDRLELLFKAGKVLEGIFVEAEELLSQALAEAERIDSRINDAKGDVDSAKQIEESEKSVAIGKLTNIPTSGLARCTHNYAKALRMDDSRQQEAEVQRKEAKRLRSQIAGGGGGGDLDDESDAAFERLFKMDQR
ncbi:MAG: hypothetical protein L6R38_005036 [Xanthoria sp. 2 TBL-2021]|nr:MAG: hypothetical protein L6R38_005036 [Xanthoria sp. 2 TBL-2021]